MPNKLTDKQEAFCREYLVDFNATQAAKRAKYSEKTAKQSGTENLAKPAIQARIAELQKPFKEELDISAERVLRELSAIAFASPKEFMSWDSNNVTLISSDLLSDAQAAAVSGVTYTSTETQFGGSVRVDLRFHDKVRALQLLVDRWLDLDFAVALLDRRGYQIVPKALPPAEPPADPAQP